ncbi:MAG: hypothetical protein ACYDEQ_04880 [Desulfocucumaceae bacterium]
MTGKIVKELKILEKNKDFALSLCQCMLSVDNGALYPLDMLAIGAVKRFLSTSSAFKVLIESTNLISARALIRIHLDTAIRFYAAWLVKNPHEFAKEVLAGKKIRDLKDTQGKKLTDAYLVNKITIDYPWVAIVYDNLCDYIHFSSQHMFSPMQDLNDEERKLSVVISDTDTTYPEFSWIEAVEYFNTTSDIFLKYLHGWVYTKAHTAAERKEKKDIVIQSDRGSFQKGRESEGGKGKQMKMTESAND